MQLRRASVGLASVLLVLGRTAFAAPAPKLPVDKPPPAKSPAEPPTGFKPIDPATLNASQGWIELLRDPKLGDWLRVTTSGASPNTAHNPWRFDVGTGILSYDGSAPEILLQQTPRGDGVLRVEWRFPGHPAKPSAGALVRTKSDRSAWFESPLAPGSVGALIGVTVGTDGAPKRFTNGARRPDLVRKNADEWNVTEITCLGSRLMLRVNGVTVADFNGCTVPTAQVGVEADGAAVEFRAIKFKPVP